MVGRDRGRGEDVVVRGQPTEGRSNVRRAYDSACEMAKGEVKVLSVEIGRAHV